MFSPYNLKRRLLLSVSVLVACVIIIVAVVALSKAGNLRNSNSSSYASSTTTPTPFTVPVSVLTETPNYKYSGVTYSLPIKPPVVTKAEAITAAGNTGLAPDTKPTAYYVLITKDPPHSYDWELKEAGVLDKYPNGVKNIPVWIITYTGLNEPIWGHINPTTTPNFKPPRWHTLNIIISADTGKYIEAFGLR